MNVINVSNELKNKVIKNRELTEEECELFLKYMITKTKLITDHMYNRENYNYMYLFFEVCYSYNLICEPYNEYKNLYSILKISNKKYLVDMNFNSDKIPSLKENKYIEYSEDMYEYYKKLMG